MATDAQKRFYAIRAALQPAEKALIDYYELQWFLRQYVPTITEVFEYLRKTRPKLKQTTVNYYLGRAPVRKALKDRGIPFEQHTQEDLTSEQIAAATTVMNMMDDRPIADKLDQLGINPNTYYAWLNDPQFKNYLNSMADQNKINIRPQAVAEFTKKINQGDWNAVKYWLDTTGEFTSDSQPQSEQLIKMFVEIIQRHVKDPETIMAIAQDVKLAAANRTLEVVATPREITSSLVNDPELEHAKKMIGFG